MAGCNNHGNIGGGADFAQQIEPVLLSEAQRALGNEAEARKILATAENVAKATRLSDLFNAVQQLPPLGAEGDSRGTAIPLPVRPESGRK